MPRDTSNHESKRHGHEEETHASKKTNANLSDDLLSHPSVQELPRVGCVVNSVTLIERVNPRKPSRVHAAFPEGY